jgi:hypothetical protein
MDRTERRPYAPTSRSIEARATCDLDDVKDVLAEVPPYWIRRKREASKKRMRTCSRWRENRVHMAGHLHHTDQCRR